ncbi:MAG: tetratricopeptide repeat protein [Candidatus Pacebacteria bacterium]|nr:tetratricopeptide repeat protein [Candidatus Paceibacterota bacterium]
MKKNQIISIILIIIVAIAVFLAFKFKTRDDTLQDQTQDAAPVSEVKPNEVVKPTENTSDIKDSKSTDASYNDLTNKAHEAYKKGDYENALKYIKQALELSKTDRAFLSLYGIQLALKNYPEAEKAIQAAVGLNSKIVSAWVEYASFEVNYMNASFEKVTGIYERALTATKSHLDVVTNYASYLGRNGGKDRAIELWQKAIELNPSRKDTYQAEIDALK